MKRVVRASEGIEQEKLAECLSEVSDAVRYHLAMEGLSSKEAEQYYEVAAKNTSLSPYCKIVEVRSEIEYNEFLNDVLPELNKIVEFYDSEAYFDCEDGSIWTCELWLRDRPSDNPLENDPVFGDDAMHYLENCMRRLLYKETDGTWEVSCCEAWLKHENEGENDVYVAVEVCNDSVEETAYVVVNRDEMDSRQQLKNEVASELCKKLVEKIKRR